MRRHSILFLVAALWLLACTVPLTLTTSGIVIGWPTLPADWQTSISIATSTHTPTLTPSPAAPTLTPTATPSITPSAAATVTEDPEDPTPTQEATVTVVDGTPIPTARPLIAARIVPNGAARNLRPCTDLGLDAQGNPLCPTYDTPLRNDMCIAVDALAYDVNSGWVWMQYFDDRLPGGTGWVSVKIVGGRQYIDFFAVHGCVLPINVPLP